MMASILRPAVLGPMTGLCCGAVSRHAAPSTSGPPPTGGAPSIVRGEAGRGNL